MWNEPFAPYTGPKLSRVQEEKERKRIQKLSAEGKAALSPVTTQVDAPQMRRTVSHFVMNLPDSAITFLDVFRGIIPEGDPKLREAYEVMPMIHCHCFTRELEQDKAEADIRRVSVPVLVYLIIERAHSWMAEGGGTARVRADGRGVVPPCPICGAVQGDVLYQLQTARRVCCGQGIGGVVV